MKHWLKVRYDLYLQVRKNVELRLGSQSKSFRAYSQEYDQMFKGKWRLSNRQSLLRRLEQSRVVIMGDFHALQQSQKAHLRVLQALDWPVGSILAVEFLESSRQKWIDSYLADEISEEVFLEKVNWEKSWGFPWEHYRPLIMFAKQRGWRVLGLNSASKNHAVGSLRLRDQHAARILEKNVFKMTDKIFVIFGDFHLAVNHLPEAIVKRLRISKKHLTLICQNSEEICFKLLERSRGLQADVIQLSSAAFCLINVPPWVKWQNYLLFLEGNLDFELGEKLDLTDEVARYISVLQKDLGFEDVGRIDDFAIYTVESKNFLGKISRFLDARERRYFETLVENNVSFYLPQYKIGFLSQISVNHVAILAMAILSSKVSGVQRYPSQMPTDFCALIWLEAVLYFGSKLVNPKRKTNTLLDIRLQLKGGKEGKQVEDELKLALYQKMLEVSYRGQRVNLRKKIGREFRPKSSKSYREAARILGGMLGEKLYFGYHNGVFVKEDIHKFLRLRYDLESFFESYIEALEIVDSIPEPFRSKKEKF